MQSGICTDGATDCISVSPGINNLDKWTLLCTICFFCIEVNTSALKLD